jgi:hypothetical protein
MPDRPTWSLVAPLVCGATLGLPAASATAATRAGEPSCSGLNGIYATLGTATSDDYLTEPSGRDGQYLSTDVFDLASGLGSPTGESFGPTVRLVRRNGRVVRWALCRENRYVADLPFDAARRPRLTGLSVNGQRVAWRTSLGARSALYVGRVSRGRVVTERRTTSRAIRASRTANGRILVVPDGTATWSLPDRGRAGVWLWPADRDPRRVALTKRSDVNETSWNVRITDDRHVLLGGTNRLVAYPGPAAKSCPRPVGSHTGHLGRYSIRVVPGASVGQDDGFTYSWVLVCDTDTGRFLPTRFFLGGTVHIGGAFGRTPDTAFLTADTLVIRDHGVDNGFEGAPSDVGTTVITEAARQPFIAGPLAGPGIDGGQGQTNALVRTPTTRVVPGAVAWVTSLTNAGAPSSTTYNEPTATNEVWLADAAGMRRVSTFPALPGGIEGPAAAVDLQLTKNTVSWAGPNGRVSLNVTPTTTTPPATLDLSSLR